MEPVKLTKSALNKFISWSTTRYNDYLGYGTKKWNVERIYKAMLEGNYEGEEVFIVQCAGSVGENPHCISGPRAWRTKQGGEEYTVDCKNRTIKTKYSNREIEFIKQ